MQVYVEAQVDVVPPDRRQLHQHLHEHAERVADGERKHGERLVGGHEQRVDQKRRRAHDVVEDGRGVGPQVVALRVEHAGNQRVERVQHDLHHEEPEQVRGEVRVEIGVCREGLRPDDEAREYPRQHRDHEQDDRDDRYEVRRVLVRAAPAEPLLYGHVHRQERRHDHAAHNELVQLVRQVVCHGVAARKRRDAQRVRLAPRAEEARDAADDDKHAHERGAAPDGGLRRCLVLRGRGGRLFRLLHGHDGVSRDNRVRCGYALEPRGDGGGAPAHVAGRLREAAHTHVRVGLARAKMLSHAGLPIGPCRTLRGGKLAEEAAPVARVAGGARRVHLDEQGVCVAIDEHPLDLLHVSAGRTLVP